MTRLSSYSHRWKLIPTSQFEFLKALVPGMLYLHLFMTQATINIGQESRAVAINLSATLDLVNHEALLRMLQLFGIGCN